MSKRDKRFTISREYTGHSSGKPVYVLRFMGSWLGFHTTKKGAEALRNGAIKVHEQGGNFQDMMTMNHAYAHNPSEIHVDINSHNAPGRARNPVKRGAPRKGTKAPTRKSQITGKKPTVRLVRRRQANVKPGYFPNPLDEKVHVTRRKKRASVKVNFPYLVEYLNPGTGNWNSLSAFKELANAKEYARAWADAHPKFHVRVDRYVEV